MSRLLFLVLMLFCGWELSAQNAISGYVNLEHPEEWEHEIHLSKLSLEDGVEMGRETSVALVKLNKEGYFSFHKKHISESDQVYRLTVKRMRNVVGDTLKKEFDFVLSKNDFIRFKKGSSIFGSYETSNTAQLEWQKLKEFEASLLASYVQEEQRGASRKSYVKDSLQILMVKLIGIKELESKALLDTDIAQNEAYYVQLLEELQKSNLEPSTYLFLEKKLAYLSNAGLERKLQQSQWIIGSLLVVCALLLVLVMRSKRQRHELALSQLSKQEKTIRNLILQGKTNKEIASELFISLSTVKTHITNIYSKLNVTNRGELLQKSTGTST